MWVWKSERIFEFAQSECIRHRKPIAKLILFVLHRLIMYIAIYWLRSSCPTNEQPTCLFEFLHSYSLSPNNSIARNSWRQRRRCSTMKTKFTKKKNSSELLVVFGVWWYNALIHYLTCRWHFWPIIKSILIKKFWFIIWSSVQRSLQIIFVPFEISTSIRNWVRFFCLVNLWICCCLCVCAPNIEYTNR